MESCEPSAVDVEPAPGPAKAKAPDASLLVEARIKAKKLRKFVEESVDDMDMGQEPASLAFIQDYNNLRSLVVGASPRLVATLPPEILPARGMPTLGVGREVVVTYRELLFFCGQIRDYLDHRADDRNGEASGESRSSRVDDGSSLFGPDGLEHNPRLLALARVKAQSLLDFLVAQNSWLRVPAGALDDFNRLLAQLRELSPDLEAMLPREVVAPAGLKSRSDELASPSAG